MVHRLVVSYGRPEDTAAFDSHYRETHAPLVSKIPGLLRFTIGHGRPMDPRQEAPYVVAEMDFDSEQAMMSGFGSEEGKATARDVRNFATGGATMTHFEVQELAADDGQ
jgi:uncharacterized protein (TIGR02118 family)